MNVCKQAENLCSIANKVVLTVLLGWRSKRETERSKCFCCLEKLQLQDSSGAAHTTKKPENLVTRSR